MGTRREKGRERGRGPRSSVRVLEAKLRTPRQRPGELPREALVDELLRAKVPVVALRAGAGYGKTITLRQWIAHDPRPAAWVTVDEGDDDRVTLLRHVVRALGGVEPLPEVEAVLAVDAPSVDGAVLPALADALQSGRRPFVLVLDDVHLLGQPSTGALLERLVSWVPDGSVLALSGRWLPPMRLTRHLVSDEALVLRRDDLAFTERECREVATKAVPDVEPQAVAALVEVTEGWPAGLYLSLLALRGASSPESVLSRVPSRSEDLEAYFHEEVMRTLDPDLHSFLVRSSVLRRLSADLCDVVLQRSDSAAVLRRLATSDNLFVVALDDDPETYRYHHLFADLLRSELRAQSPGDEIDLRVRAAEALAERGEADAAVEQALAARAFDLAAEIVGWYLADTVQAGAVQAMERWLAGFPEGAALQRPEVGLLCGWLGLLRGDRAETDRWLAHLALLDEPTGGSRGVTLGTARAALAMVHGQGGVKGVLDNARIVRDAGPVDNPWWGAAEVLVATALFVSDPEADPVELFAAAEFASRGEASARPVATAHLGWSHLTRGDEATGHRLVQEASAEMRSARLQDHLLTLLIHGIEAFACAKRGEHDGSLAAEARALDLLARAGRVVPRAICHCRVLLAETALLRGDVDRASAYVAAAAPLLADEPDAVVLKDWVDRLRVVVAERRRTARQIDGVGLTGAERRVLAELPTHRSLEEIGEVLYISRNTVKTHAVSIYRKLGVSGRSAAVDRAREVGLLDGQGVVTPSG